MSTRNIPFSIKKKKITRNHPKSVATKLFQGSQERVLSSLGKRVISAQATEVLLYIEIICCGYSTENHLTDEHGKFLQLPLLNWRAESTKSDVRADLIISCLHMYQEISSPNFAHLGQPLVAAMLS